MPPYGDRFRYVLEYFFYTFSGSLFMLIYVDFELIWELILVTFGVPKRSGRRKCDLSKMCVWLKE